MLSECRRYLTQKLKGAMGEQTKVCLSLKELSAYADSHVAAVLVEGEALTRSGRRLAIQTSEGAGRATQLYRRELRLSVVLGEYSLDALEGYYAALLASLDTGLVDDSGYHIALEPGEADWVEQADSLLNAKVSVQLSITFTGGLYRPIVTKPLDVQIVEVELEC